METGLLKSANHLERGAEKGALKAKYRENRKREKVNHRRI